MHLILLVCPPDFGLFNIRQDGRTGFRCARTPFIRAGRLGAPCRLSDRSLRSQLCATCRPLPARKILSLSHTDGSPLRLVKHSCFCQNVAYTEIYFAFIKQYLGFQNTGCFKCCCSHNIAPWSLCSYQRE